MGAVLYEVIYSDCPYKSEDFEDLYKEIFNTSAKRLLETASGLGRSGLAKSNEIVPFLEFILNHDPVDRPSIDQVIERMPVAPAPPKSADEDSPKSSARGIRGVALFLLFVMILV